MLRSVVHKKDSFLVKYVLKDELNETLVKPYIETNVDTDLFDIEHKGIQSTWWHPALPGQHFVWAEILRAKDTTPEGYYRFKNPIAYYKLESDADTDPHRAVSLTPVDVILTTKHVVLCIDKQYWDSSKPYADIIVEKLKNVFRVIEKSESSDYYDVTELMGVYDVLNANATVAYLLQKRLGFGLNIYTFNIYKETTADSDVYGKINYFGFNLPDKILIAKAGETLRYYDIRYCNDNELIPLVVDENDPNKAYVLMRSWIIVVAENSFLERDEIYNLLANILSITHTSGFKIDYYVESQLVDTFHLPENLFTLELRWWSGRYLYPHKKPDGRFNLDANTDINDVIYLYNQSRDVKTVDKYVVYVDGQEVHSETVNKQVGVYCSVNIDIFIPSQPATVVTGENIGTGDGSTTKFHLSKAPVKEGSEKIYVNGELKTRGTDYEINYENGEITFTTAPANGATITADYTYYVQFKISFLDPNGNELAKLDRLATFE